MTRQSQKRLVAASALAGIVVFVSWAVILGDFKPEHQGLGWWVVISAGMGIPIALSRLGLGQFAFVVGLFLQFALVALGLFWADTWWQKRHDAKRAGA